MVDKIRIAYVEETQYGTTPAPGAPGFAMRPASSPAPLPIVPRNPKFEAGRFIQTRRADYVAAGGTVPEVGSTHVVDRDPHDEFSGRYQYVGFHRDFPNVRSTTDPRDVLRFVQVEGPPENDTVRALRAIVEELLARCETAELLNVHERSSDFDVDVAKVRAELDEIRERAGLPQVLHAKLDEYTCDACRARDGVIDDEAVAPVAGCTSLLKCRCVVVGGSHKKERES